MKRPIGVSLIALLLIVSSFLTLVRALSPAGARLGHRFLVLSVIVSVLAFFAAEALWRLRPHAFLAFTLWSLCAMAGLVLSRLPLAWSGHGVRLMEPIVYAGLVYAFAALYLRRVT